MKRSRARSADRAPTERTARYARCARCARASGARELADTVDARASVRSVVARVGVRRAIVGALVTGWRQPKPDVRWLLKALLTTTISERRRT